MRCMCHWRLACLLTFSLVIVFFWYAYSARNKNDVLVSAVTEVETVKDATRARSVFATTQEEMTKRLNHLHNVCERYDVQSLRRVWYSASNRQVRPPGCSVKLCPMLVDEEHLLFMCFIAKVGSSSLKELFLALRNKTIDGSNSTAFHLEANEELLRVSASFYPEYKMRRFFKGLIVRHPFERLVSAYADKAAPGRKERQVFYDNYFIPAMKKFRGNVSEEAIITFKEFVEYLITTHPLYYDAHWFPYWSRCDVCRTPYDFVARLETVVQDTQLLLQQIGVQDLSLSITNQSKRKQALKYFEELSPQQIVELYKTFFLDFKLFGYSVDEFMSEGTNITSIDESVQLYKLLF